MKRGANWAEQGTAVKQTGGIAGKRSPGPRVPGPASTPMVESARLDADGVEELREFMATDGLEVHADPGFRERLRGRLWEMIRVRDPREDSESG